MDTPLKLFVTTARGLEPLLADELKRLGLAAVDPGRAGVACRSALVGAYRICLWSRVANRVLLNLADVAASDAEALYKGVLGLRWEAHLRPSGTLAVDFTGGNENINHTRFGALKVKDAVVDRFRRLCGQRPSVDTERPELRINVHLRGSKARVSIDLSGESLHRRGYRCQGGSAPLKETLAAGILLYAGWPAIANRGGALVDPMCGSGTLPIEAAMIAGDIAPGLQRTYFGFFGWLGHDAEAWTGLLDEALERRERGVAALPPILGRDRDPATVALARENVAAADLAGVVVIEEGSAESASPGARAPGLVVVNPPYGERLGRDDALPALYRRLGETVRERFGGWHFALFTGNPRLAAGIGLKPEQTRELYNGRLQCRLFDYRVESARQTAPRFAEAYGREERRLEPAASTDSEGARQFANRLRKNLKRLGRWARRSGVSCYRLYDADLPDYAVAVDLYGTEEGLHVHLQEYEAPPTVDPALADRRLGEAWAVAAEVLEVPLQRVHVKVRRQQKGAAQYERRGREGRLCRVEENGRRLFVNFTDYLDTGLFLDHRITRQMVADLAEGQHFLNLFCYTGSATVYAATGGARATTSVDLSQRYLDWARRNLETNGVEGPAHQLVRADCLAWLEEKGRAPGQRYGLIFLDPPTFSNSKRMEAVFDVQRDHVALIRRAARLLEPGGVLIFSNNHRRFRLDEQALDRLDIEEVSAATIPEDFARNPRIHRCWLIRRPAAE